MHSDRYTLDSTFEKYYNETDAIKRQALLDEIRNSSDAGFAQKLFKRRYRIRRGKTQDIFMGQCLTLSYLSENGMQHISRSNREILKVLDTLMCDVAMNGREEERVHLYHEYRNVFKCYIDACNSPDYRPIAGLIPADSSSRRNMIIKDVREMTTDVTALFPVKEALALWCEAAEDAVEEMLSQ